MGEAKCDVTIRSNPPMSPMAPTHSRTASGARASANALRMGARSSRPLTASYPGQPDAATAALLCDDRLNAELHHVQILVATGGDQLDERLMPRRRSAAEAEQSGNSE